MPTFYLFFVWALLPLLSVGQNLLGRHSEARAEADFAANQRSFADTEAILAQLKTLDERTIAIAQTILKDVDTGGLARG